MLNKSEVEIVGRDPWNELVRQTTIVAVPLDQVLRRLKVPQPETGAIKDELFENLTEIIAQAGGEVGRGGF